MNVDKRRSLLPNSRLCQPGHIHVSLVLKNGIVQIGFHTRVFGCIDKLLESWAPEPMETISVTSTKWFCGSCPLFR